MDVAWTISELAERAVAALAAGESAQLNGRVRDLPNERLIRWYTTIGLVDPPLGRRGRVALYGPRHLLQLVAVKRRQASGRSIAEIQVELAGATDAALSQIAALPDPAHIGPASTPAPAPATPRTPDRPVPTPGGDPADSEESAHEETTAGDGAGFRRPGFWKTRPNVSPPDVSYRRTVTADGYGDYGRARPPVVQGVRLAPDLTLLLNVPALSDDDLTAIEDAARPLLDVLRRRGLAAPSPEDPAILSADLPRRSQ